MVKLILDSNDIIKIIEREYTGAKIVSGVNKNLNIVIELDDINIGRQSLRKLDANNVKEFVRTDDGNIDANKSGLVLKNRETTTPGGAMGRTRNRLPVF